MGSGSLLRAYLTIVAALLLADLDIVSGMRTHADIEVLDISWASAQLIGKQRAGGSVYAADRGRKVAVYPSAGSASREVKALIAFKDSVTKDPTAALKSWNANDSDACGWRGVKCSSFSNNIVGLDLRNLGLVGVVPELIGYLNYLEHFDVSKNLLRGSIPDSIANCSSLSFLNIAHNEVGGDIPSSMGKLFQLQILLAAHNNMTGLIPESIGNSSLLEVLDLTSNFLVGPIPFTLSKLSGLHRISLGLNSLSGTIPSTLGNCSSLVTFNVSHNLQLGGDLPEELSLLKKTQVFLLYECSFVGAFPTWVINFTSLLDFEVHGNSLTGEIPEEIGQFCQSMTTFSLSKNSMTGPIPRAIVNCTALVRLAIDNNDITGDIPSDIGLLRNLEMLVLYQNEISGVIPSSIANCSGLRYLVAGLSPMSRQLMPSWISSLTRLEYVWILGANLYGEIPVSFGQLSQLEILAMDDNYIGGALPSSLGNLSLLQILEFSYNQLHGEIPFEITGNLTSLVYVSLGSNNLVGSIPKFTRSNELLTVEISSNMLTGNFDSIVFLGNPRLSYFSIRGNNFSGPLLDDIGNISNLNILNLSWNRFYGSIPPSWGNLTSIVLLSLSNNSLDGVIPLTLIRCTRLNYLGLSFNEFKGPIPLDVGHLGSLVELNLERNFLSGTLPSSLANLTHLTRLDLSYNRFSGPISGNTISMMKAALIHLDVSSNFMSGSWPQEFSLLTNLRHLDVSFNNMSGSLLGGLVTCFGLAYLDISVNNFSGGLPQDLGLLQHLRFFNAAINNFEGPIPDSGLFSTKNITLYSFLGNPRLCGSAWLVSLQCSQPPSSGHYCKGFKCRRTWIPVAVSISIAIFVVIVILYLWIFTGNERNGHDMMTDLVSQGRIVLSEDELMTIIHGGGDCMIGTGAKSIVYKGERPGGELFALKVLRSEGNVNHDVDEDTTEVLLKEVQTLAQLRHVNIIKILGLCITQDVKAIILEFMPRGSLHDILHDTEDRCELFYRDRFKIILGITEALVYLHHSFREPIIHRDLKPSNVLLGIDLNPKLADFGISRFAKYFGKEGEHEASASTVCGTFGYLAPEYATQARISTKGDVYSYGVVLLELLTGRKPFEGENTMGFGGLVEMVTDSFKERPFQFLDPSLAEEARVNSTTKDQLMLLLRVGLLCTREAPSQRPDMSVVLTMLRQIEDVGSEVTILKTMEELANESSALEPELAQPS